MILYIPDWMIEQMRYHADLAEPNETAGLLFGTIVGDNWICTEFECIGYGEFSPGSFILNDAEKMYPILKEAQDQGLLLLSIFHTHPQGLTGLSGFDLQQMKHLNSCGINTYKNKIWVVMTQRGYSLRGFFLEQMRFLKEILIMPTSETGFRVS